MARLSIWIVVSRVSRIDASSRLSKPVIEMSPGTDSPMRLHCTWTPSPRISFDTTASSVGTCAWSASNARAPFSIAKSACAIRSWLKGRPASLMAAM